MSQPSYGGAKIAGHLALWSKGEPCSIAPPLPACNNGQSNVLAHGDLNTIYYLYIYVVDVDPETGLSGVTFGVDYESGLSLGQWSGCADLEFTGGPSGVSWPEAGSGIIATWERFTNCQTESAQGDNDGGVSATVGAFYVSAYEIADLEITPREYIENPDLSIADCEANEYSLTYPYSVGVVSFGDSSSSYDPCFADTTGVLWDITVEWPDSSSSKPLQYTSDGGFVLPQIRTNVNRFASHQMWNPLTQVRVAYDSELYPTNSGPRSWKFLDINLRDDGGVSNIEPSNDGPGALTTSSSSPRVVVFNYDQTIGLAQADDFELLIASKGGLIHTGITGKLKSASEKSGVFFVGIRSLDTSDWQLLCIDSSGNRLFSKTFSWRQWLSELLPISSEYFLYKVKQGNSNTAGSTQTVSLASVTGGTVSDLQLPKGTIHLGRLGNTLAVTRSGVLDHKKLFVSCFDISDPFSPQLLWERVESDGSLVQAGFSPDESSFAYQFSSANDTYFIRVLARDTGTLVLSDYHEAQRGIPFRFTFLDNQYLLVGSAVVPFLPPTKRIALYSIVVPTQ